MNNTCHRAVPHVPVLAGQLYSGSGGDEVLPDPEEVWLSRLQVAVAVPRSTGHRLTSLLSGTTIRRSPPGPVRRSVAYLGASLRGWSRGSSYSAMQSLI